MRLIMKNALEKNIAKDKAKAWIVVEAMPEMEKAARNMEKYTLLFVPRDFSTPAREILSDLGYGIQQLGWDKNDCSKVVLKINW